MGFEDAFNAARASRAGAVNPMDELAAAFEFTASQLQPDLGRMSEAVGREVDAASFALGMMSAGFVIQGLDLIEVVKKVPVQIAEFLARADAMQGRTVCADESQVFPSVKCGLDPGHEGQHAAGRLRW